MQYLSSSISINAGKYTYRGKYLVRQGAADNIMGRKIEL